MALTPGALQFALSRAGSHSAGLFLFPGDPTLPERRLNAKERAFCERYPVSLNAKQAAIEAGYAASSAKQRGSILLSRPAIQAAIEAQLQQRSKRTQDDADRVLEELAVVAFSDIDHYTVDPTTGRVTLADDAPKSAKRAISSVKFRYNVRTKERITEIHFWDKNSALTNAMKHLGLLRDKLEVTGKDGGPIEVDGAAVRAAIAQRLERLAPAEPLVATPCS